MDFESQRKRMVDALVLRGYLRKKEVIEAMLAVPRDEFMPDEIRSTAYVDTPQPIGCGQTISAPHMVAIMTELLEVEEKSKVLEVGAGSGYQAAVIAEIAKNGKVYTVERVPELAGWAKERLAGCGYMNAHVFVGDGTVGLAEYAPYDRIIVTAASPHVPKKLLEQLSDPGLMLIPVGGRFYQELISIQKENGKTVKEGMGGCVFVPLIGEDGW